MISVTDVISPAAGRAVSRQLPAVSSLSVGLKCRELPGSNSGPSGDGPISDQWSEGYEAREFKPNRAALLSYQHSESLMGSTKADVGPASQFKYSICLTLALPSHFYWCQVLINVLHFKLHLSVCLQGAQIATGFNSTEVVHKA